MEASDQLQELVSVSVLDMSKTFYFFSTLKEVVNRLIHTLSSSRSQQTMVKQRPTRTQMSERAAAARPDPEPTCSCWLPDDTSWCLYPTLLPPCQWLGLDKTPEKSLSLFFISLLPSSLSVLTDFSWTGAADKTCSPGYLFHRGKKKKKHYSRLGSYWWKNMLIYVQYKSLEF